ncbi:mitotic deacetylase associated SANT domain protein a isoform X2 [Syngnathoides biaculeatus]|uniref:mitotic deacetylase associated SANT domain protein a isoform X2 n=1 Tax=Syngnathoides biaculeatus TaxID=300417 RepID=UPI002ADDFAF0|nr:mitotic deacetylase associated SANT domain protein a isoform X2 [Syngnathoides biaculeatus]
MSLPPQMSTDKSSKHRAAAAMKEPLQHSGDVYYGLGPPSLESSQSDTAGSSGVYNPEKAPQVLPPYQQVAPVKWVHQDSLQAPGWPQEAPVPGWGQNFAPYMGGVNARGQMAFHKAVHDTLQMGGENQQVYRDAPRAPAQARGLEWEQQAVHQAQLQAYQHKGVELQGAAHVPAHNVQAPMLQPFQTTFNKQQFPPGYYSVFPGNKGMQGLAYGEQPKTQQQQQQQQLLHHMQQQQQQQLQQQQLQKQHQLQLQQQLQQQQMQQQQMQHMQQQYHHHQQQQQQQLHERQQQIHKMQQQQQQQQAQTVAQQDAQPPNFVTYQPPELFPPDAVSKKEAAPISEPPKEVAAEPPYPSEASDTTPAAPRRSRRLSRDGQSPLAPPSDNLWAQTPKETSQNGVPGAEAPRGGDAQAATGGVIQSTRRKRRASKEINLETLAQKASEMPSMPESLSACRTEGGGPQGKQATMVPLIMPVSVPVHRMQIAGHGASAQGRATSECKPSVIVARRRSLRNSEGENDPGLDEEGKTKQKRRPRPEPLIIPPPRPSTLIPASVYSSISAYQSNLRSPVRLPENPLTLPPYTPPPILSPVREGSGLYFSTFLTNYAVTNQILPPLPTPKSATRSLLRSTSSDITPPVLPLITDATPVSLEPRINIGQQYQAEIPELRQQNLAQLDAHKAELVWLPLHDGHLKNAAHDRVENLMNMACSSVLSGGGTNQELALHCLHESGGDLFETLSRLLHQEHIFPKGHHLAHYHYSGSDRWSAEEKHYFNKGMSAYRKDFILVQKLVQTKTVAQCVEFYYTYKKQVKIARNGILTYGPSNSPVDRNAEAVVDIKSSQQSKPTHLHVEHKKEQSYEQESNQQAMVAHSLQAHDYAGTVLVVKEPENVLKDAAYTSAPHRPQSNAVAKKTKAPVKPVQDPDAVFPCKKCGRVFNKVKSRSAHMKSHAEQEKKAAALRQRAAEEQAAVAAAQARKEALLAVASAASHQGGNGVQNQEEPSSQEDSSEGEEEDDNDEDWH